MSFPNISRPILFLCLALGGLISSSCSRPDTEVIEEGILFSVEYEIKEGKTGGFTRLNMAGAVPGGNGSWNIDAYGKLTEDYLIITRPQKKDLDALVIPSDRLVRVQFGDGGITEVNENQPNSDH